MSRPAGHSRAFPEQVQKAEQEAEKFAKSKFGGGDQGQDGQQQEDTQGQ